MFNKQSKTEFAEIFLRPKETVYIPFKYLSYKADDTVHPQVSDMTLWKGDLVSVYINTQGEILKTCV